MIGGKDYSLPSHHWNTRSKPEFESFLGYDGVCSTTIDALDVHIDGLEDLFIAGDSFMQMFYTVFDRDLDMVGLAPAVHSACEAVYHYGDDGSVSYIDELC